MLRFLVPLLCVVGFGCAFDEVDLSNKMEPCVDGFQVGPNGTCIEGNASEDAGIDADLSVSDATVDAVADADAFDTASMVDATTDVDAMPDDADAMLDADAMTDADALIPDAIVPDALLPIPCPSGVLFCDDFETAGQPEWTMVTGPSTDTAAAFDTSNAFSGNTALKGEVLTRVTNSFGTHYWHDFPAFTGPKVYLRAYVYLGAGYYENINLFGFSPNDRRGGFIDIKVRADKLSIFLSNPAVYVESPDVLPKERWICIEVDIDIAAQGMVTATAGTTSVTTSGRTQPLAGLERFYVGPYWAIPSQNPTTYYLDDVAVDLNPLPCD